MTNYSQLPHEKLRVFQEARALFVCVRDAELKDSKLRDQALRAAKSICLNIAEGAGRTGAADKARVYAIARGETCEVAAALELASLAGECREERALEGMARARSVHAMLGGLIVRPGGPPRR